jgi:hypothetical protein
MSPSEVSAIEMAGRLTLELVRWIIDLIEDGDRDAMATVRREIMDRRDQIAANRALRDRQLRTKYGVADDE